MQSNQSTFSSTEIFAFTFCSTITLGVSMLPYSPMGYTIRDPWLSLILAACPYALFGLLLVIYARRYRQREFFDALKQHVYAPIYYIMMVYLWASSLYFSAILIINMFYMVQRHLLVNTVPWVTYIPFFLVIGMSLYFGIQSIVTFIRMFIVFELIVLFTVFLVSFLGEFDYVYLSPLFATDLQNVLKSAVADMPFYGGVVSLLALIHLADHKKKFGTAIQLAIIFVMIVYGLLCFTAIGNFGHEESAQLNTPIQELIQTFTTYGQFQRLDLIFMLLWITSFFKMILIQFWFSLTIMKKVIPAFKPLYMIVFILVFMYAMLVIFPHLFDVSWSFFHINMVIFTLVIPVLLLTYLILRYRKGTAK